MRIPKGELSILVFAAVTLVLGILLPRPVPVQDPRQLQPVAYEEICSFLTAIASDASKMKYVKQWIASRLADAKYLESLRAANTEYSDDEALRTFGDLDWESLGIATGAARLRYLMELKNPGWDVDHIYAVEISLARKSIVIDLAHSNRFAELKFVGEDVYVDCRSQPGD